MPSASLTDEWRYVPLLLAFALLRLVSAVRCGGSRRLRASAGSILLHACAEAMTREPLVVHRRERTAERVACGVRITGSNELDEDAVERERLFTPIVELRDELRLLL